MRTHEILEQYAESMEPSELRTAIQKAARTMRSLAEAETIILLTRRHAHIIPRNGERCTIQWNAYYQNTAPQCGNTYTLTKHPFIITYFYPRALRIQCFEQEVPNEPTL